MKKIFLVTLFSVTLFVVNSQAQVSRWYSYASYVMNNSATTTGTWGAYPYFIWNDTTARWYAGATAGYTRNYQVSTGLSFAPRLSAWDNHTLYGSSIKIGPGDVYVIDSVRIQGTYLRNNLVTTPIDTLKFTLVYGNGTPSTNLLGVSIPSAGPYGAISVIDILYDSINNTAGKHPSVSTVPYTQSVLLSNTDTATLFSRSYALTTPYTVPAGQCAAMSLSFKSGDASFFPGDTVTMASGTYKHGAFRPRLISYASAPGVPDWAPFSASDSNMGYYKVLPQLYGWSGFYVPQWVWTSAGGPSVLQYPMIDYHVTCATCRLNEDIAGTATVCVSGSTTLTHSLVGGTWSSSVTGIATVSSAGVVNGIAAGTATITYNVSGNFTTRVVTVSVGPGTAVISGPTAVCTGSTITLTSSVTGGVWSSGATGIATVSSSGVVFGVASGTATISYTTTSGCGTSVTTYIVTVSASPPPPTIAGPSSVCVGSSITLTASVSGGTWSTTSPFVTLTSGGSVIGMSAGTALISYTVTYSCGTVTATTNITVNPPTTAGTISGAATVCIGSPIALTSTVPGGTWSSGTTGIATVSSSGVVTGVAAGTATISYTVSGPCGTAVATHVVTVSSGPAPPTISGPSSVCVGATVTLTGSITGGTWSTTSLSATVSSGGVATGVSAGVAVISYTITAGCGAVSATTNLTVNPAPNAGTLSGADTVCIGSAIILTSTATGGSWTASNTNATVSSTGDVTGVTAGPVNISYTVTNPCGTAAATHMVTVVSCTADIEDINDAVNGVSIFPNPAHSHITITSSSPIRNVVISNMIGRKVVTGTYNAVNVTISLEHLPPGIYFVRINNNKIYKVTRQ